MKDFILVIGREYMKDMPTELPRGAVYFVGQLEVGEQTGWKHWQCYIEYENTKQPKGIKRDFGINEMHIETRRGTQEQAIAYAQKEETRYKDKYMFELGQKKSQGRRTDLESIGQDIVAGATDRDIALRAPGRYIQYGNRFDALRDIVNPAKIMPDRKVIWLWGPPGSGKTRVAWEMYGESMGQYYGTSNAPWFDYKGEKCILVDDYNTHLMGNDLLLKLTDIYPNCLPIKGGVVKNRAECIFFTSNTDPHTMGLPDAFWRRVTRCELVEKSPRSTSR